MSVAALTGWADEAFLPADEASLPADEASLLAAAVSLAAGRPAPEAVPALLELLAAAARADAVTLTATDGAVLHATAMTLVGSGRDHAVAREGAPRGVLTVHGGRDLPALAHVVADLLALLLPAAPAQAAAQAADADLARALLRETERDLDHVAGLLHDGPAQDAVAARCAAVLVERGLAGPAEVTAAADSVGAGLRVLATGLRSRGADGDLVAALHAGVARLADVVVEVPAPVPATDPTVTALACRVVSAALAPGGGSVTLLARVDGSVDLLLTGLGPDHATAVADRFTARSCALGLQVAPEHTALRLRVPAAGPSGRTPQ